MDSHAMRLIVGVVVLLAGVFFIASLTSYGGVELNFRSPRGESPDARFSLRFRAPSQGEPGPLTSIAQDINETLAEYGWYQDLSRFYFDLGEPLRVALNWLLGALWAFMFLVRRR